MYKTEKQAVLRWKVGNPVLVVSCNKFVVSVSVLATSLFLLSTGVGVGNWRIRIDHLLVAFASDDTGKQKAFENKKSEMKLHFQRERWQKMDSLYSDEVVQSFHLSMRSYKHSVTKRFLGVSDDL